MKSLLPVIQGDPSKTAVTSQVPARPRRRANELFGLMMSAAKRLEAQAHPSSVRSGRGKTAAPVKKVKPQPVPNKANGHPAETHRPRLTRANQALLQVKQSASIKPANQLTARDEQQPAAPEFKASRHVPSEKKSGTERSHQAATRIVVRSLQARLPGYGQKPALTIGPKAHPTEARQVQHLPAHEGESPIQIVLQSDASGPVSPAENQKALARALGKPAAMQASSKSKASQKPAAHLLQEKSFSAPSEQNVQTSSNKPVVERSISGKEAPSRQATRSNVQTRASKSSARKTSKPASEALYTAQQTKTPIPAESERMRLEAMPFVSIESAEGQPETALESDTAPGNMHSGRSEGGVSSSSSTSSQHTAAAKTRARAAQWLRALNQRTTTLNEQQPGWKSLELQLDEAEGNVRIRVSREDGGLNVSMAFSDSTTLQFIESQAALMQEALESSYQSDVNLSLHQEASEWAQNQEKTSDARARRTRAEQDPATSANASMMPAQADPDRHEWIV